MSVKVTIVPPKPVRKVRKQECHRTVVRWVEGDTLYTRYYKRDSYACEFAQTLIDSGLDAKVVMI